MISETERPEEEAPRRKLNRELVQMARYLSEVGPRVNEIARVQSRFTETVRYRYNRFFRDQGITVQAMPSYAKLGFKRLVLIVRLAPACERKAGSVFSALCDLCYLHSFTRVMLNGAFFVHVAVPAELAEQCAGVYMDLHRAGFFTDLEVLVFDEMRNPPMRPESFDFITGRWKLDWKQIRTADMRLPLGAAPKKENYDKADLMIIKELEKDAGRSLMRMAANMNFSLSGLEFHYRQHVKARGLVKGYRLVWQGTHYDFEKQRPVARKDYIELTILLEGGTRDEVAELMMLLNSTPFLWSEAYGSAYCAELFIPQENYVTFLQFVDDLATRLGEKLRIFTMDQQHALRFVISYTLFDGVSRKWQLNPRAVLRMLEHIASSASP